ncbi:MULTISPECIES: M23 family metallopeptidase [unclassified Virgibacillus]|uniref:M23 family metallopeptidase n=1 Tax=unclassified Virgibacillus TaxID=2620237 RepID=UPI0024DE4F57|nr:M23 family metallopeptidase [Virgibacillus sp. LDC-1]
MVSKKLLYSFIPLIFIFLTNPVHAAEKQSDIYEQRMAVYKKTEALTQVPWYYLAAIDQYERQIQKDKDDHIVSISIPEEIWYGLGNSTLSKDTIIIDLFNGQGKDGNGDGKADAEDPEDILYTIATIILQYGITDDEIRIALWNYYKRDLTVQTIKNTAKVLKKFQHVNLTDRDFPVSIRHNYSYRSTWGDRRGFGGLRIHEGTDIFAGYGTPVKSTTYGVIEMKGWNLYGGWRIGIRDIFNIYHYYGHLNGYADNIKVGQVVKPGDELGSVGSSGYGPPGTSGKFPPHLHYGMYKDNGHSEWSFDPYPYLRKWERMAKAK